MMLSGLVERAVGASVPIPAIELDRNKRTSSRRYAFFVYASLYALGSIPLWGIPLSKYIEHAANLFTGSANMVWQVLRTELATGQDVDCRNGSIRVLSRW